MITRLLMCALVIALAGCAGLNPNKEANERYDKMMDSYLGKSERTLVSAWGPPNGSYESGGVKYLRYVDSRTVPVPAPLQTTGSHNRFVMFGGGAASVSCNHTFEIEDGIVVALRYRGNGCR